MKNNLLFMEYPRIKLEMFENTRKSNNVELFHDYVKAHLWANKPLKIKSLIIKSKKDLSDILRICEMIMDKKEARSIETEYEKLDMVIRKAFPTSIFDRKRKLNKT